MNRSYKTLILGASYGSLLGTKLILAGHKVTLVCTKSTAELINAEGTLVRIPVKGKDALLEIDSNDQSGLLDAAVPESIDPAEYDLVVLGMQEPQYGAPGVRELMLRIAQLRVPCMAIMNMPPLAYLKRLPGLITSELQGCYANPAIWAAFDPSLVTLASPDPQAFRPPEDGKNVLQVSLPTNFKVARFDDERHTAMLVQMQDDIEAIRYQMEGEAVELPVKLKVFDSLFVPLAKWNMLLTGNYRCIQAEEMIPIKDAVHSDLEASRQIYNWVGDLALKMGASKDDQVPFDKYANAAKGLAKPSSAARALAGGATNIERVDCLVNRISNQLQMNSEILNNIVGLVESHLEANRSNQT